MLAELGAKNGRARHFFQRVKTHFDFVHVDGRRQQTAPEQTATHACARAVEHVEEGRLPGFTGKQRLDQFQIANGGGVEYERVGAIVESGALEVIERGALGVAEIVQDGGGCAGRQRTGLETATVEGKQMKVIAQAARGVIRREDPGVDVGFQTPDRIAGSFGKERLACIQTFERGADFGGVDLGGTKLSSGDVYMRDTGWEYVRD